VFQHGNPLHLIRSVWPKFLHKIQEQDIISTNFYFLDSGNHRSDLLAEGILVWLIKSMFHDYSTFFRKFQSGSELFSTPPDKLPIFAAIRVIHNPRYAKTNKFYER